MDDQSRLNFKPLLVAGAEQLGLIAGEDTVRVGGESRSAGGGKKLASP
jgi:hypothetical protein